MARPRPSVFAQPEFAGDLAIAAAFGDQPRHISVAVRVGDRAVCVRHGHAGGDESVSVRTGQYRGWLWPLRAMRRREVGRSIVAMTAMLRSRALSACARDRSMLRPEREGLVTNTASASHRSANTISLCCRVRSNLTRVRFLKRNDHPAARGCGNASQVALTCRSAGTSETTGRGRLWSECRAKPCGSSRWSPDRIYTHEGHW